MTQTHTPNGFASLFSQMVAEASMDLPPLMQKGDSELLRAAFVTAIDAFWGNYISLLPGNVQEEYQNVCDGEETKQILAWFAKNADFEHNKEQAIRARNILEEINGKLPALLKQEYAALHS